VYYTGLIHHIKENKTDLTERCDYYGEALDRVSKKISERGWIASDCEFSVLSDSDNSLKSYCPMVAVSGGFDPVHIGHIRLIQDAAKVGKVMVILNSDRFLLKKKGYVFMRFDERKEIMEAIKGVDRVVECVDNDDTVIETLRMLKPDYFANGGDVDESKNKEINVCKEIGCKLIYNVGGGKIQSSSQMVAWAKLKGDMK
jgi:D-beta-D-heptose 7-phosphate kinase/D-beta-D-heptose 1-phosphate adenosyltransferase